MTVRLTVAQALVRFLAVQHSERDGTRQRLFAGCFGIFGHGNVAGVGQALLESARGSAMVGSQAPLRSPTLRYLHARNEQAMVHAAVGYARMRDRLSTFACTTSIGPGATNLVTGAALATVNRIPVLLLPGDIFATRAVNPVLQELEDPRSYDVSVNDSLRPVSRYWDRINRPEQLVPAALAAMRVLTDPAETGAVTLALPQDVQAEAYDWPEEFLAERTWRIRRPVPEPAELAAAAEAIRESRNPLIVAGGGVIYSGATEALRALAESTGIPVAETQAGKGSLRYDHPQAVGAVGATGTTAANALARDADVVIGIGTRYSDFTTASRTLFAHPHVRFVNINVATPDAVKLSGIPVVADAKASIEKLDEALTGWRLEESQIARTQQSAREWDFTVSEAYAGSSDDELPSQSQIIGVVNEVSEPRDVVVCAAGSMPGDLHKLWRTRDPKGYHVEYGYSCMGYEIAGGLGVKLAAPDRDVFVMVGDGSYLMMAQELVTAVAEGIKLVVVLVDNRGYASIGALSESVGSQRFGTQYRYRDTATDTLTGPDLPVDLAANAASLGADVLRAGTVEEFRVALGKAKEADRTTVVYIRTDPMKSAPDSQAWWDVPVAEVSTLDTTADARKDYETNRQTRQNYL